MSTGLPLVAADQHRTYDDPCGVARALDVVGERWGLLVVRELLFGPKRFADLSRGLPGMSQNVLSQRLRELEHARVVQRLRLGPPASSNAYELTARGYALEPVLLALAGWGSHLPLHSAADLSVAALILALKTAFDSRSAAGLVARFELRFGEDCFTGEIADGQFTIARGAADQPDARVETDAATFRELVFGGYSLGDAVCRGDLRLEGDADTAARLLRCFPRPGAAGG